MHLGTKGRYAVMALLEMLMNEKSSSRSQPIPLSLIADHQEISVLYLEQIFSKLRKKGLVQSIRGAGGGYVLGKKSDQISIAEIMEAVGEQMHATRCIPGTPMGCMRNKNRCQVHHLWEELGNKIYDYLKSVTLEDICAKQTHANVGDDRQNCYGNA